MGLKRSFRLPAKGPLRPFKKIALPRMPGHRVNHETYVLTEKLCPMYDLPNLNDSATKLKMVAKIAKILEKKCLFSYTNGFY